jgi:signal transduction histidine kinase
MNEVVYLGIGILVGGAVGALIGARLAGGTAEKYLSDLLGMVRSGRFPDRGEGGGSARSPGRDLEDVLRREWAERGRERDLAMREAMKRLADFLRHRVESPLLAGLDAGGEALRDAADAALDAVEDLEFFLEDPPAAPRTETTNLVDLVGEVTREFAGEFTVYVKVEGPQEPLRIHVDPDPLKDALFLVLHNAGEFGGGGPVNMVLRKEEGRVRISVRDEGPGFSAEALLRALDPFYTTSPGGLGLGLPYARMAVEAQGGEVVLRNPEGGGAEVMIILPQGG